jgi:predicted metal-dependent TIM-barrel fold hydrolase
MWKLVDAHVHADGLRDCDLETLARFGVEQALICAHDGALRRGADASARDWLQQYESVLSREPERFRRFGIRALFALGVHPAAAPWRGLEELLQKLPMFLSHPAVVAIGPLPMRNIDPREEYVLCRQLELAGDLRRPLIIAAPVRAPARGLRKIIALVRAASLPPEGVLVENLNLRGVALADTCGYAVALEASPGRLSAADIEAIVEARGPRRFVLTSHAGEGAADLLAVPFIAAMLRDGGLSRAVVSRVARENALSLLGRGEHETAVRYATQLAR